MLMVYTVVRELLILLFFAPVKGFCVQIKSIKQVYLQYIACMFSHFNAKMIRFV